MPEPTVNLLINNKSLLNLLTASRLKGLDYLFLSKSKSLILKSYRNMNAMKTSMNLGAKCTEIHFILILAFATASVIFDWI